MKKVIATILLLLMLCSLFSGVVSFAEGISLETALEKAERKLYGMYTASSAQYLRDCYDRAKAIYESEGTDNGEAIALSDAVDALVPLDEYNRSQLIGFVNITNDDISSMKLCKGTVTADEGVISIAGEGTLRYANASANGIVGDSPFGVATDDCDAFALKISSASGALLDVEIGKRGGSDDCIFTLSNVVITEGESFYLLPFECFGDIPVDGTLNYISLAFSGTSAVSFSDLHAARTIENTTEQTRSMAILSSKSFNDGCYYKITARGDSSKVFAITTEPDEQRYALVDPVEDDDSQEWRITKDSNSTGYRIINKLYGTALTVSTIGGTGKLDDKTPNLTNTNQEWGISYTKKNGFSIGISGGPKLTTTADNRVRCTSGSAKYFDIYELPKEKWNLVWSEEFNDGELDTTTWRHRNGKFRPDREPVYYTDSSDNIYFEDRDVGDGNVSGNLVIKTILEDPENSNSLATSSYIDTVGSHLFTYGRVDIRAQLPEGKNIWPAGWMMGTDTLGWAACGELDIIEMVGSGESNNYIGDRSVIGTIHCSQESGIGLSQGGNEYGKMLTDNKLSEAYHTYSVEWDAESIRWFWDDILYFVMPIDSSEEQYSFMNNPMYIILNTSIDGNFDGLMPEGTPTESYYYIDYIRYYKQTYENTPETDSPVKTVDNFAFYDHSIEIENALVNDSTGNKAIVSGQNQDVKVYDIPTGTLLGTYDVGIQDCVASAAASPDGSKYVFVEQGGGDSLDRNKFGQIIICDSDMKPIHSITGVYASGAKCAITPDSKYLVVYGRPNSTDGRVSAKKVHVFDLDTYEEVLADPYLTFAHGLEMANDGKFIAYGCDGTAKLYSNNHEFVADLNNDIIVGAATFSADSSIAATCNTDGVIRIWNAENGELLKLINGIGKYDILSAALNSDGSQIVVGCSDYCARIFDIASGKLIKRMVSGSSFVATVKYSPDYSIIAAAGNDGRLRIYDADGNIRCILKSNRSDTGYLDKFLFSADGKYIAGEIFITQRSCLAFWELPEGLTTEKADFSSLQNLAFYNETSYTADSYAVYSSALKTANEVKANPYSTQAAINSASQTLQNSVTSLVEAPTVTKGDFDGDEQITATDALAALRIAAKLAVETADSLAIGDIDGDGHITVTDALAILRVAAKLSISL